MLPATIDSITSEKTIKRSPTIAEVMVSRAPWIFSLSPLEVTSLYPATIITIVAPAAPRDRTIEKILIITDIGLVTSNDPIAVSHTLFGQGSSASTVPTTERARIKNAEIIKSLAAF